MADGRCTLASDSDALHEVTATQFRDRAAEVLKRAAVGKRRTLIKRHGEALDDAADARAAALLERMAKARTRGIPWSEARKGLVRKPGK